MTSCQQQMWYLVPPDSPPSAPALHSKAKNKPFALLQSLEPPRGPDFFPMQRFRGYLKEDHLSRQDWRESDNTRGTDGSVARTGGGLNRFSQGDGARHRASQHGAGLSNAPSSRDGGFTGTGRVENSDAAGAGFRAEGAGYPPCNTPSRSQQDQHPKGRQDVSESQVSGGVMTPARSSSSQQGFSVFGGAAFSTPGRGSGMQIDGTPLQGTRGGSAVGGGDAQRSKDVSRDAPGIARVRSSVQQQTPRDGGLTPRRPSLALSLSPPVPVPMGSITTPSLSSPSLRQDASGTESVGAFEKSYTSPSTMSALPQTPSVGRDRARGSTLSLPATPAARTNSGRIRSRPTSTVPPPRIEGASVGDGRGMYPVFSADGRSRDRTWASMDKSAGAGAAPAGQHQPKQQANKKRPKPSGREETATLAKTRVSGGIGIPKSASSSRSPRPKQAAGAAPSPHRGPGSGSARGPAPTPRKLTLTDFIGAEEACFNAGASSEGLAIFLDRCEARGTVALATLWADLTTSFSAVTVKSCLPSQSCHRWNCACGRQPRACQARAPIIGAVVHIPAMGDGLSQAADPSADAEGSEAEEDPDFPEGETYLIPLSACHGEAQHAKRSGDYQLPIECQTTYDERWQAAAKLLAMPVKKVAFNAQVALMPFFAWKELSMPGPSGFATFVSSGVDVAGDGNGAVSARNTVSDVFDPRVAAWMTDTGSTDKALEFEALCKSRLPPVEKSGPSGGGKDTSTIVRAVSNIERCCRRSIELAAKLSRELEAAKMLSTCEEVEMPAIPVLAGMEVSGVVFLPERVTRFSQALGRHLEDLRRTASDAAGGADFNLASPDQVADLLFKRLGLPSPPLKAGSTHASTSAEVLAGLLGKHPVVAPILEFRGVNKLRTTYVDKLAERALGAEAAGGAVPASQGVGAARIHAAWNQTAVRTGRLSCSRPNLQQIPKGSDPLAGVAGVNIRDAFVAPKNFTLMAADYSQIEMRVLADACRDPGLANLFALLGSDAGGGGSGDVYRRLAAQVFKKEERTVSDPERTRAKVVCLGIIYGMGHPQVARKLGVTESQAQGLVRSFLKAFPGIEPFLAATRRYAREKGYVCTLTGRRRHLPEINNARNAVLKAQAERQAVNSVVQGTAADIIKSAMVLVADRLDRWRTSLAPGEDSPRMVMQIHDELVFECPAREEDLGKLKGLLKECMEVETPAKLGVKCPLTVNMLVGMSWGSMRPVVVSSSDDESDIDSNDGDASDGRADETQHSISTVGGGKTQLEAAGNDGSSCTSGGLAYFSGR